MAMLSDREKKIRQLARKAASGVTREHGSKIEIKGYRRKTSNTVGTSGTFYFNGEYSYLQKDIGTYAENSLKFKNALVVPNSIAEQYEGLPLEYLFYRWNPDDYYTIMSEARKLGIETGQLMDRIVTEQAIEKGYDGLIMGNMEIVDLRTHYAYRGGSNPLSNVNG